MRKMMIGGLAALLTLTAFSAAANTPLDRIVAVVNDEVILNSELEERMDTIRMRMGGPGAQMPPEQEFRRQVLDYMIDEAVQLQRGRMGGLRVSDDEVNQALARIASQNNVTLAQLPEVMEAEGLDYATVREQIRRELMQQRVQQRMLHREVTVSDREVQEFLAEMEARGDLDSEYLVSHIMIGTGASDDAEALREAREKAENVHQQLQEGADFGQMAVTHSDSRTALEGGDMGWRAGPELPTVFAERVVGMNAGDITAPFRTSSGYHILKLQDVRRGDQLIVQERRSRHILIRPSEVLLPEQAQLRLVDLRRRIVEEGESFSELAREHSQDPGSASLGGDLGWQTRGQFVPAFDQKLDQMEIGEISEPFQTQFGFHIVQLMETRERDRTLDARRNQAQQFIRAQKAEERMDAWLQKLRDESYIEIRLGG
ncbi:peptidylprolyl isomerase [Natronospira bacteriovora]|uniref:Chaperone SurA n=1 Tax=Natronospira bacteriovora TaxID=3069753 RepID=A0ABU0W5N7_9GAMM|nr:peptidylprolyl isomerase [Natronospira sp. AB-CW4]MDQ2068770.1 peptidylprolyl isomerase [Natronospira sp. AB-CW4]